MGAAKALAYNCLPRIGGSVWPGAAPGAGGQNRAGRPAFAPRRGDLQRGRRRGGLPWRRARRVRGRRGCPARSRPPVLP